MSVKSKHKINLCFRFTFKVILYFFWVLGIE
jgi:hypothetical protein